MKQPCKRFASRQTQALTVRTAYSTMEAAQEDSSTSIMCASEDVGNAKPVPRTKPEILRRACPLDLQLKVNMTVLTGSKQGYSLSVWMGMTQETKALSLSTNSRDFLESGTRWYYGEFKIVVKRTPGDNDMQPPASNRLPFQSLTDSYTAAQSRVWGSDITSTIN